MALGFPTNPSTGTVYTFGSKTYIWNGHGWAISQSGSGSTVGSLTATSTVSITTTTNSTSTDTGALIVSGGAGIGGAVYIGQPSYIDGAQIITTATLKLYSASTSNYASNLIGGDTGYIPIQSAPDKTSFIPIGSTGTILSSLGTTATWVSLDSIQPLVWTSTGTTRVLTGYTDNGTTSPIRTAAFTNNLLTLTLASFTPSLTATAAPTPSINLNWDVPLTGFAVSVVNPTDFTTQYVAGVNSATATGGTIGALAGFTPGTKSATPAGGVAWTQSFANNTSFIYPTATTIAGGSVTVAVNFNYWNGSAVVPYTKSNATFIASWQTPSVAVNLGALTGQTFLGSYSSTSYTIFVTGVANASNYTNTVSATGGTVSSPTGNGTLSFTDPINKDNLATVRGVLVSTAFTRPASVTGAQYSASLSTTANITGSFTYPSFWVFTTSVNTIPTRTTVVSGNSFRGAVTQLANQTKAFSGFVNNPSASPQAFWFGVLSSVSQPTSFQTGASQSLLSNVTPTTGSVVLQPDTPPAGYVSITYNLYGITLGPSQSTYVSIG
jgi:hypothetical protein